MGERVPWLYPVEAARLPAVAPELATRSLSTSEWLYSGGGRPRYLSNRMYRLAWTGRRSWHVFRTVITFPAWLLDAVLPMALPDTALRKAWTQWTLILVMYVAIDVPLQIAFRSWRQLPAIQVLSLVTSASFCLDIIVNFRTAFMTEQADVIRSPRLVALHYIRGFFLLDLLSALPLGEILAGTRFRENAVWLGLLKLPRLFRLARHINALTRTKYVNLVSVARLLLVMLLITHWAACLWCFLAQEILGWPWVFTMQCRGCVDREQYVFAFYRCFLLMLGDRPDTYNNVERVFAVAILSVGACLYAVVVGSITMLVSNMWSMSSRHKQRASMLQDALRYKGAGQQMRIRIDEYYNYMAQYDHPGPDGVSLLSELPAALHAEVLSSMFEQLLVKVQLFAFCERPFLWRLAQRLRLSLFMQRETIYHVDSVGHDMYVIWKGAVGLMARDGCVAALLCDNDHFGELGLMTASTPRPHRAVALRQCDIMMLSRWDLQDAMRDFPQSARLVNGRARVQLEDHEAGPAVWAASLAAGQTPQHEMHPIILPETSPQSASASKASSKDVAAACASHPDTAYMDSDSDDSVGVPSLTVRAVVTSPWMPGGRWGLRRRSKRNITSEDSSGGLVPRPIAEAMEHGGGTEFSSPATGVNERPDSPRSCSSSTDSIYAAIYHGKPMSAVQRQPQRRRPYSPGGCLQQHSPRATGVRSVYDVDEPVHERGPAMSTARAAGCHAGADRIQVVGGTAPPGAAAVSRRRTTLHTALESGPTAGQLGGASFGTGTVAAMVSYAGGGGGSGGGGGEGKRDPLSHSSDGTDMIYDMLRDTAPPHLLVLQAQPFLGLDPLGPVFEASTKITAAAAGERHRRNRPGYHAPAATGMNGAINEEGTYIAGDHDTTQQIVVPTVRRLGTGTRVRGGPAGRHVSTSGAGLYRFRQASDGGCHEGSVKGWLNDQTCRDPRCAFLEQHLKDARKRVATIMDNPFQVPAMAAALRREVEAVTVKLNSKMEAAMQQLLALLHGMAVRTEDLSHHVVAADDRLQRLEEDNADFQSGGGTCRGGLGIGLPVGAGAGLLRDVTAEGCELQGHVGAAPLELLRQQGGPGGQLGVLLPLSLANASAGGRGTGETSKFAFTRQLSHRPSRRLSALDPFGDSEPLGELRSISPVDTVALPGGLTAEDTAILAAAMQRAVGSTSRRRRSALELSLMSFGGIMPSLGQPPPTPLHRHSHHQQQLQCQLHRAADTSDPELCSPVAAASDDARGSTGHASFAQSVASSSPYPVEGLLPSPTFSTRNASLRRSTRRASMQLFLPTPAEVDRQGDASPAAVGRDSCDDGQLSSSWTTEIRPLHPGEVSRDDGERMSPGEAPPPADKQPGGADLRQPHLPDSLLLARSSSGSRSSGAALLGQPGGGIERLLSFRRSATMAQRRDNYSQMQHQAPSRMLTITEGEVIAALGRVLQ